MIGQDKMGVEIDKKARTSGTDEGIGQAGDSQIPKNFILKL